MQMQIDIEVLKTELHNVRCAVSDIGAKMDILLALQTQIVRLQEQHDNVRQALERAFVGLNEVREVAETTETKLMTAKAFFRGAVFVGFILFGFAQWYVLQQLEKLQEIAVYAEDYNLRLTLMERALWPDKD